MDGPEADFAESIEQVEGEYRFVLDNHAVKPTSVRIDVPRAMAVEHEGTVQRQDYAKAEGVVRMRPETAGGTPD